MMYSPELIALAGLMAGEFDNREQAIADPAWYVHLRLWQRPVPLFAEDSLTLFAEQANALYLDRAYRQRIIRLQQPREQPAAIQVQYYMLKDPSSIQGAGIDPERLKTLTIEDIEYLPGCTLTVTQDERLRFQATLPPNCRCCFTFGGETYEVSLGFEANLEHFLSYDKGIDPATGKAIWGALLGPYRFTKRQDFSAFVPI